MSRIALYRKYRSADFADVVGQKHVTRTLEAAVERGIISHAYLLTGPRGTGKTSIARILARRVNGLPVEADLSRELDIIEIDAASNRGIDEMRSLREKIMSAPTNLKYKVYIIDEVHMLTREAFNALLKTLEEPPAHAVFVLATTEAHKLPETIISRTQRFDLRPITESDLVDRLSSIARSEGINIDEPALAMIARASRGGFRDAIGLLDQLSVLDEELTVEQVSAVLGMAAQEDIEAILVAIAEDNPAHALERATMLISAGNDPQGITHQLLDVLRLSLLTQLASPKESSKPSLSPQKISHAADCLTKALVDFKVTQHYSLPLELALYRASSPGVALVGPSQTGKTSAQSATRSASPVQSEPVRKSVKPAQDVHENIDTTSLCTKGLSLIKERNNSLYAVMRSANPRIEGDRLVLECRFSFHKERIEEQKNRQLIEQVMTKTFGHEIQLDCRLSQAKERDADVDSEKELVASALEILGGEVVSG